MPAMPNAADSERVAEQMRLFGQNMRAAREDTGLAQDKLQLEKLRLDKKMVSYLELGVR
jgi:cytoskeletal protein RodZ